jgi:quercetin dioxygenase-like cupin family protein
MQYKYNEATLQRPDGDRILDAPIVEIDIADQILQIRCEEKWQNSNRNAITVFKTESMQVVLLAMHKGAEMKEYSANCLMTLLVIEGTLVFSAPGKKSQLKIGEMIALHRNIPHSISAKEESVFLMTLVNKKDLHV